VRTIEKGVVINVLEEGKGKRRKEEGGRGVEDKGEREEGGSDMKGERSVRKPR